MSASETPRVDREEYTVTKADIGFKVVNPALARILEKETKAKWIDEELADGDRICAALGVERTEGGRLPTQKILNAIRERHHGLTKDCWCRPMQDEQEPTVWIHNK